MARKLRRDVLVAGALLALAGTGLRPAQAAEYTLKFGLVTIGDSQHFFANELKNVLPKATNGRVEVQVFPRGQLGSPAAQIQGLQTGTIEAFMVPIDFFVGLDPRAGVFSIPFMFKNRDQANKVMGDKELYDNVLNLLDSKGIVGGMVAVAADGKYIARNPLKHLSDFNGKKMRVNATDPERERMKRLGATAIPMGLADMITSLQSGVIDGTMSGISIHVNFHLETVSKELLRTNDTMLVVYLGLSKKWLDSMPPDLRKTVVDTIRGMHPQMVKFTDEEDSTLTKKWLERGGSFFEWSKEDMAEFHKRIDSVGEDVTKSNPSLNTYYKYVKSISDKY
jgi:TRAP-type C4-dicarboxylate transport system substrate-binding protein